MHPSTQTKTIELMIGIAPISGDKQILGGLGKFYLLLIPRPCDYLPEKGICKGASTVDRLGRNIPPNASILMD
jgi:hypothetical protein